MVSFRAQEGMESGWDQVRCGRYSSATHLIDICAARKSPYGDRANLIYLEIGVQQRLKVERRLARIGDREAHL